MKLVNLKFFLLIFCFQCIGNQCFAQNPVNDEPCVATDLIIAANCSTLTQSNSFGATNSLVTGFVAMSCGGAVTPNDVWFKVKTTQSGIASDTRLTISVIGSVAGQIRFLGATNCSGPFTELKCSASPTAAAPTLNVDNLTPNTIYYVQVAGYWDNSIGGPFSVCCTPGVVLGCTNPFASNYNTNAVVDDGSCQFSVNPISKCDATLNNSPNILINDNQTVTDSINVSLGANRVITDMDVIVKINHSFVSDLEISLVSPNGTNVVLFKNDCGGNDNLEIYFDDNAYNLICTSPVKGFYKPTNGQLSAFNNQLTDGYWKLKIKDNALNNSGTLVSWCLKPKFQSVICNAPTQLLVESVTANAATLNWTQSGTTNLGFDVAVLVAGAVFNGQPTNQNVVKPFVINALQSATNYVYYVRSRCAAGITSGWSGPFAFTTAIPNNSCNLNLSIPENSTCIAANQFFIDVNGVTNNQLGTNVLLDEVRLVIFHDWTSDLQVSLTSPSGKTAILAYQNGGSGDHFGDPNVLDCSKYCSFSAKACQVLPEKAPFVGRFLPVGDMSIFNDGSNPNGIWTLRICDTKAANIGQLRNVNLVFNNNLCAAPSNIVVTNIQATSTNIGWQSVACDTIFAVYGAVGFNPNAAGTTVAIQCPTSPPYTLAGLQTLTKYDIYLQKKCAVNSLSDFSCPITFETPCNNATPSLQETFDTQTTCNAYCGDTCVINGNWYNVRNDDFDWIVRKTATLTPESGPDSDVNGSGNYIYTETGGLNCQNGKKGILLSKCLNVNAQGDTCSMSFYYNMYGVNMGELYLDCTTDGGATWQNLWSAAGNKGKKWIRQYIDLSAYNTQTIQLRFVGISGDGSRSEIGLDQLSLYGVSASSLAQNRYYKDADNDGFGVPQNSILSCVAIAPNGFSAFSTDCNDANALIYPGAPEIFCNKIDENCNGNADDMILPIPVIANDSICKGGSKTLTVSSAAVGSYYWATASNSVSYVNVGNTITLNNVQKDTSFYIKDSTTIFPGLRFTEVRLNGLRGIELQNIGAAKDYTGWYVACSGSISLGQINTVYGQQWDLGAFAANQVQTKQNGGGFTLNWTLGGRGWVMLINNNGKVADAMFWNYSDIEINNINATIRTIKYKIADLPWSGSGIIIPGGCGSPTFTNTIQLYTNKENNKASDYNPCFANSFGVANNTFNINESCVSAVKKVTLSVKDVPILSVSQNPSLCEGQGIDLRNIIINDASNQIGAFSYHSGSPASNTNLLVNTIVAPVASKTFVIKKVVNPGCVAEVAVPITVHPKPILNISVIDTSSDCTGQTKVLTAQSTNGNLPYSYQWSFGATQTQVFVGSSSPEPNGIYKLTVSDANACKDTAQVDVSGGTGITKAKLLNIKAVSSCNGADGKITLLPSNGTPPFQYAWSGAQSGLQSNIPNGNFDIINLKKGTYTVTITDNSPLQCELVIPFLVVPSPEIQVKVDTIVSISCYGKADGQIKLLSNSGFPLVYKWSNNATTKDIVNLPKGKYSCTITNTTCTQVINDLVVQMPDSLDITNVNIADASCTNNGKIDIQLQGGTKPFSFVWSNSSTTEDLANVPLGIYKVSISDSRSCKITSPLYVLKSAPALGLATFTNPAKCFAQASGFAKVVANGGGRPYSYLWSNGSTNDTINQIKAGIYYVTVTDANGCQVVSLPVSVTQPTAINAVLAVKNITCQGKKDGEITLIVSGGNAPFRFSWSHTTKDSASLKNLLPNIYKVTITDQQLCSLVVDTINIKTPTVVKLKLDNTFAPTCIGRADGRIFVTTSGGVQPYSYSWSNGSTFEDQFAIKNGYYNVVVTDSKGCKNNIDSIKVTAPQLLSIDSLELTNPKCFNANNGKILLRLKGNIKPYIYKWDSGIFSPDIFNLNGGNHTVTVTDAIGCAFEKTFQLIEPQQISISINAVDSLTCYGAQNAAIDLNVTGGVAPLQFIWNNNTTSEDLINVGAGSYKLAIFDAKGCTASTNEIIILQPLPLTIALKKAGLNGSCNSMANGLIDIDVNGGARPYDFQWSTTELTEDIVVAQAGNYGVTVTDRNGCDNVLNGISMLNPVALLALDTITTKPISCHNAANASIVVKSSGGQSPYNFNWSNGNLNIKNTPFDTLNDLLAGSYNVTITDVFGCVVKKDSILFTNPEELNINLIDAKNVNCKGSKSGSIDLNIYGGVSPYRVLWNNNDTTANVVNLMAGTYKAKVTDANNCVQISNNFTISEPLQQLVNQIDSVRNGNCGLTPDGAIFMTTNGGEFPYKYLWNNGLTQNNIKNLPSGKYVCRVSDALNCVRFSDTVNVVQLNTNISILINQIKNNKCANNLNGLIDITPFGGQSPYNFKWSNGATSEDLNNIASGNYIVTISDFNNCKQISSTINVTSPDSIQFVVLNRKKASTNTSSDGYLVYNVLGGTPPYKIVSSSGVTKTTAQDTIKGLQNAVVYEFAVRDANDCVYFFNNISILTDLQDFEYLKSVFIYPNPVSEQLQINLDFKEYIRTNIRLVNTFGQIVYTVSNENLNFFNTIDVSHFPSGMYNLQILGTDNHKFIYNKKIVVTH